MAAHLPSAIAGELAEGLGVDVESIRSVPGGDVNAAYRAETSAGPLFVKTRPGAVRGAFAQEGADLEWLGAAGGLPVPAVRLVHDPTEDAPLNPASIGRGAPRFLALDWIDAGPATPESDERLGRGLAAVHAAGAPTFGAASPLHLGDVTLPNDPRPTFAEFYAEQRLLPLARLAVERGAFSAEDAALIEQVAARLPELAGPAEPPARTHGDLWSGNVLVSTAGEPHLIDPVAHGGHREVDLATLRVFGGPSQRCFDAYAEAFPLGEGHEGRVGLWQLNIILLHVVLFGEGYRAQAVTLARPYA